MVDYYIDTLVLFPVRLSLFSHSWEWEWETEIVNTIERSSTLTH